eukprot:m.52025 g.52025  ORF g.52025 m.52025 type:complete len:320 (+) comp34167_c0_seq1:78-1037(+)
MTLVPIKNITPADPYLGGCFINYTPLACFRTALLSGFAAATFIACLLKIISLHRNKHRHWNHYAVFYAALLECTLFVAHWMVVYSPRMIFAVEWLGAIQILAVLHFFTSLATAMAYQDKSRLRKIDFPAILLLGTYFTGVMIFGIISLKNDDFECAAHAWLLFSASEFALVQIFALVSVYINRTINSVMTSEEFKKRQKRHIWGLVIVFETATTIGLVVDITAKVLVHRGKGCLSIFFIASKAGFTVYFIAYRILKYFMPIWAMCMVFHLDGKPLKPAESTPDSSTTEVNMPWIAKEPYVSHFTGARRHLNADSPSGSI